MNRSMQIMSSRKRLEVARPFKGGEMAVIGIFSSIAALSPKQQGAKPAANLQTITLRFHRDAKELELLGDAYMCDLRTKAEVEAQASGSWVVSARMKASGEAA